MGAEDLSQLGASRLGPGYTAGTRPTSRPVYVDLDVLYGDWPVDGYASAGAPADSGPDAVCGAGHSRVHGRDRGADQRAEFAGQDGQPSVRRPGRLICSGEVRGTLTGWERDERDRWVAVVAFTIPLTAGDPRPGRRMEFVALPLPAVRPADSDSPPPRSATHQFL